MEPETPPETPAETPAAPPPTPAPEKPAEPPKKVELDPAEYVELLKKVQAADAAARAAEAAKQAELEAARKEHLKKLAEKEGAEAALKEQHRLLQEERDAAVRQATENHARLAADKVETTLALGLSGKQLVSDAAGPQLLALLGPQFETVEKDGKFQVVEKGTGKPAAEALAAKLASPAYSHFFRPASTGGSGSTGTGLQGDPPSDRPDPTKAAVERFRSVQKARNNSVGL